MKKIKNFLPTIILIFSMLFMFLIYEPITLYGNNVEDLWFDLHLLVKFNIKAFLLVFLLVIFILVLIYLLFTILNKIKYYNYIIIIINSLFISSYIEGNYLSFWLPKLDGSTIFWNSKYIIVSYLLWSLILLFILLITKKFKTEKVIKVLKYINLSIFLMLIVSLIPLISNKEVLKRKEVIVSATSRNLNNYSTNKNFIIFLLDAVDSQKFNEIMTKKSEYKAIFKDFTYYPDTLSGYRFTRDSIPLILNGDWNCNEKSFNEFYIDSFDNSKLLKMLKEKKYDINIYEDSFIYNSDNARRIDNVSFNNDFNPISFAKQETKYILFKYLPYGLKKYSKIEWMNFDIAKIESENIWKWVTTKEFYNDQLENKIEKVDSNQFKFIHIEGAHTPFDLDINFNSIENGTYDMKVEASILTIKQYLKNLKESNVYDDSVIMVMSDHGYDYDKGNMRQNPILFIKGYGEKNNKMLVFDKPISHDDLISCYKDLLDDKNNKNLFENISNPRERRFIKYDYLSEDHMVEYIQTGKAWDEKTLIPTGKEFNR